jgi:hypothetical protein
LASALKQDQNLATNKEGKKSEVAWRNRQAKLSVFARQTLVVPSEVEESRGITESSFTGSFRLRCAPLRMTG